VQSSILTKVPYSNLCKSEPQLFVPAGKPILGFKIIILPVNSMDDQGDKGTEPHGEMMAAENRADFEIIMQRPLEGGSVSASESAVGEVGVVGVGVAAGYLHGGTTQQQHDGELSNSAGSNAAGDLEAYCAVAGTVQRSRFVVMRPEWEQYPSLSSCQEDAGFQRVAAQHVSQNSVCFRTGDLGYIKSSGEGLEYSQVVFC
jgi:acyl-CoA synthetase (AMP-forming)/AMP-acid ligase II